MNEILSEIKEVKKRSRVLVSELTSEADEQSRIMAIFVKIREKVTLLPSEEERTAILNIVNEIAARHKAKYEETQNVIMTIEREISLSSDEEPPQKRVPPEPVPSISFRVLPKETFVVPVLLLADCQMVATSHLSRAYILQKTDVKCKQCVQSRNETFSGWYTARHGFDIKKYRLDPSSEEENSILIGQWKAEGYDIKATHSGGGLKFIPIEQATEWYAREDIGHAKQLESLKKNCTHSPVKK